MGLSDFFGELIADIRQMVVEEPWFGRSVTPPIEAAKDEPAIDLGWIAKRQARRDILCRHHFASHRR